MNILIIGDIHGRFDEADRLYDSIRQTHKGEIDLLIQVGDFGFWPRLDEESWLREFPHRCVFIDGNHDDHETLRSLDEDDWGTDLDVSQWKSMMEQWEYMPRGTVENGILYIGGARSLDRHLRQRGVDWFPEENIKYHEQRLIFDQIREAGVENIHTVISHDCPGSFDVEEACTLSGHEMIDGNRKFLEAVKEEVHPERWYFGHYHQTMEGEVDGVKWRCIDMIRDDDNDFAYLTIDE